MLFITSLSIFTFCFVFYIIWSQFLKKDARLSVGLQILQKKMSMLENFSDKTDIQLRKGIDLLDKKNRELEKIVNEARFCIFKLEKLIKGIDSIKDHRESDTNHIKINNRVHNNNKPHVRLIERKEILKNKHKSHQFDFGESPFSNLNFIESSSNRKKDSPIDPSI